MKWMCNQCDVDLHLCPGEGQETHGPDINLKCPRCSVFFMVDAEGTIVVDDEEEQPCHQAH